MNYRFFNNSNTKRYIFENLCHELCILNYGFYVYFITSFLLIHELNELLYPLHFTNNLSFLVFITFSITYIVKFVFCYSCS